MKKLVHNHPNILIVSIFIVATILLAQSAQAQVATTSGAMGMDHSTMTGMDHNAVVPTETNTTTDAPQPREKRMERREMLGNGSQERIINLASNVVNRFNAITQRFTNISDRIESRIKKMESNGIDTSGARAKLLEAQNSLSTAKSEIGNLPSIRVAATNDKPRESLALIKTQFMAIRSELKRTQSLLMETIALLKAPVPNTATGTTTSTTQPLTTPSN